MEKLKHHSTYACLCIWLVIMMVFPNSSGLIKIIFMFLFIGFNMIKNNNIIIDKKILAGVLLWQFVFCLFIINGLHNGFEYSSTLFEIYIIRPLILLLMCSSIRNEIEFSTIINILITVTIIVDLYNLINMLGVFGIIPQIIPQETALTIVNDNFLTMRLRNQTSLIFLSPFIIVLGRYRYVFKKNKRIIILITYVTTVLVSMLSGRRILQLLTIGILVVMYFNIFKKKISLFFKLKTIIIGVLSIIGIIFIILLINRVLNFNVIRIVSSTIARAFDSKEQSTQVRNKQAEYLIAGWLKNPFIGHGLQSYVREYKRSENDNWSYEFFYIALLFQTGIFGIAFVIVYILRFCKGYINKIKNSYGEEKIYLLSVLIGFLCFFVAGATNPLVTSIWMWFIFISVYCYTQNSYRINVINHFGE